MPPMIGSICLCPVCRRELPDVALIARDKWFGRGDAFEVHECSHCRLAVTHPQPSIEELEPYYPDDYQSWEHPSRGLRLARDLMARTRASLPPWGPFRRRGTGAMLDVGCGRGDLLVRFAEAGWSATGLDISENAVRAARELGVEAIVGTIDTAPLPDASFDLVVMNHALEHLHDPVDAIGHAHRLLRRGGSLIVAVPNWDSRLRRWFGTNWMPLEVPRHLTHFSPRALHLASREAGFRRSRTRRYALGVGLPTSLWFSAGGGPIIGRRHTVLLAVGAGVYPVSWVVGRLLGGDGIYLVAQK
jgi:SAM-dependent methyltransferase